MGKHTIYEALEYKYVFFVCTDEPGTYYEAEGKTRMWPRIVNAQPVLYTKAGIEILKKQPNLKCLLVNFGKDNAEYYHKNLANALKEYNENLGKQE